jgi:hypothetical protein
MHERTTRQSIVFKHPFSLPGIDHTLPAGTYVVETLEELVDGLSFVAYCRVSTTMVAEAPRYGNGLRQLETIDPADLEEAQRKDAAAPDSSAN